jgi:hypothetical protein
MVLPMNGTHHAALALGLTLTSVGSVVAAERAPREIVRGVVSPDTTLKGFLIE